MRKLFVVILILAFSPLIIYAQEINSYKKETIPKAGDVKTFLGIEFVYIPSGGFTMGNNSKWKDQKPPHKTEISKGFWISKYEITQKQWKTIMRKNPSHFKGDDLPVDSISWFDAQDFIKKLNSKGEGNFRLPTETEWEYACRAGSETAFYYGNDESLLENYAWTTSNSDRHTHPVGEKLPNAWGLYDMIGNVWEWCEDWYDEDVYKRYDKGDSNPPQKGKWRVRRGASGFREHKGDTYPTFFYRSSWRGQCSPKFSFKFLINIYRDTGIRCVRDL